MDDTQNNNMTYTLIDGFWSDAGTPESLAQATKLVKENRGY